VFFTITNDMPTFVQRRARGAPKLDAAWLSRIGNRMLGALDLLEAELSVLLVDDEGIRVLNREHRDKDKPTDVLSFPQPRPRRRVPGMPRLLGDVVISLPTALRQARSRRRELMPEVRFLLAHGILHLVGYDHGTPVEKRSMDAAARRLVRAALVEDQTTPLATRRQRGATARETPSRQHRPAGRKPVSRARPGVKRPGKLPTKSRLT
jgi:probable rRNA maturation factor